MDHNLWVIIHAFEPGELREAILIQINFLKFENFPAVRNKVEFDTLPKKSES